VELLIASGAINEWQLDDFVARRGASKRDVGAMLLEASLVSEETLLKAHS
jgi:hypothetical protein